MDNATIQNVETVRECTTKFGKLELECTKCTENTAKDGFVLTLKHERIVQTKTPFGMKKTPVSHTFFMKVAEECKVGFTAVLDLDDFVIKERLYVPDEPLEDGTTEMWLKWLHVGVQYTH